MKINLKNDIEFKMFFVRKGNEEFLIDFLSALLKIDIKSIQIEQEVDLGKTSKYEKGGKIDLQATLNNNIVVDIEIQVKNEHNIIIRSSYYAGKLLSKTTKKGTEYEDIKKIIMVNILDYNLFPFDDDYISETIFVLKNHREFEVDNNLKFYYIELPQFRKQHPDMNNKLNQWLAFIDNYDKEMVEMAINKNKTLKKASQEMEYLTGDAEEERWNELREKWEMDRKDIESHAYKRGIEQGIEKMQKELINVKKEMVKNMLEIGSTIEQIKQVTKLSEEEIENLKKEIE